MEHKANRLAEGQSHMEITIKKEVEDSSYVEIEIDMNCIKQPELGRIAKSEPMFHQEDEILEGSSQNCNEQHHIQGASTSTIGSMNEVHGTNLDNVLNIKKELGEADVGTNVLQNIDTHYRINKNTNVAVEEKTTKNNSNKPKNYNGVSDTSVEDKIQDGNFKCGECLTVCKTKQTLMKHRSQLHSTEPHTCVKCDKEFKCKAYLQAHVKYAHGKLQSKCEICKKVYKSKRAFTYHFRVVHGRRAVGSRTYIYTCDHCQKKFWKKAALRQHIQGVHGERIHHCRQCTKVYKCRHHLQQHITAIHGKPQHECEVCHKLFTTRYILKAHAKKAHDLDEVPSKSDVLKQEIHDSRPAVHDTSVVMNTVANQPEVVVVKEEPVEEELEFGPVVLQRMDSVVFEHRPCKEEPQLD